MIRFVTATRSEAKPLIARYAMAPRPGAFPWYVSSNGAALVVSGVGKRSAAAAAAFLHAKTGEARDAVWLNVGIAGHSVREPGDVLVAHTVRDGVTDERWYPPRIGLELTGTEVVSVDTPETTFERDAVYEMEAAGFYPTALRFGTSELVQVAKITSDNRERSFRELTAARVSALVEGALEDVTGLAAQLDRLRRDLPPPSGAEDEELSAVTRRWRFTTSETRALARLLVRFRALEPGAVLSTEGLASARSGSDALRLLTRRLRELALERPV